MSHKVLTLLKTELNSEMIPIVPGATEVQRVHDNIYFAYGPYVKGVNTKWMRGSQQVLAALCELSPGKFLVIAEQDELDIIDPTDKGLPIDQPAPLGSIGSVCFSEAVKPRPEPVEEELEVVEK
jgi:hypothetical protein